MKISFTSAALSALLPIALLSSCDRSVSTVSSENGSVAVVPRFAAASVPAASRLEARLSATGQSDSVVNVAYQKGGDLELGSVPSGASFTVNMTGYDSVSTSTSRIVRWAGSGSGTADNGSATKYVDISTVSGPSVPTGTVSGTAVPETLSLASGVYYTTDGSDPRIFGTVSNGTVPVLTACTVKAAAKTTSNGVTLWSDTVSWMFTASTAPVTTVSAPTFSVAGGTYTSAQTVTLASSTSGASIYYTTDGSAPTSSSTLYAGSLTVSASETIRAIAVKSGWTSSLVTSATYTITPATPAKPQYTLTVTQPTGGTISLSKTGSTFDSGTTVIATATATSGYTFSAWTGASTSKISVCTLSVTNNLSLSASFTPATPTTITTSSDGMRLIPAGTFTMGSPTMDETQHSVTLSAFYMDSTDVTQGQYLAVMGVNPSYFSSCGTTCPVEYVTWFDAVLYCNARSKKAGLDTVYSYTAMTGTYGAGVTALTGIAADLSKSGYRLPTEAQWEYAARGGTTTAYYWGDDTATATVSKYAWYTTNASSTTHPVATKLPNPYGLYDMAGNVWQWTNDWYGTYSTTSATDPSGPSSGTYRVDRGGSWTYDASILRSANRGISYPAYRNSIFGFRSVRPGS